MTIKGIRMKAIPNFITSLNLLCGCVGITMAFYGKLDWAAYLVGIAAVLDFLDGFVARMLNAHSEMGKQLDSLADMVTFGVLPGIIMFHMIQRCTVTYVIGDLSTQGIGLWGANKDLDPGPIVALPFIAFLIPVFSAIRLAKFNLDTRQSDSFIGLPTPANTILIASFPLILGLGTDVSFAFGNTAASQSLIDAGKSLFGAMFSSDPNLPEPTFMENMLNNIWFLSAFAIISSLLLIAPVRLFALKFKGFGWKGNEIRYVFLVLAAALLVIFKYVGITYTILLYIILSLVNNMIKKPEPTIETLP
jgi:CDP-diacylglycerol---serine O-phosphatidyltransferase